MYTIEVSEFSDIFLTSNYNNNFMGKVPWGAFETLERKLSN